MPKEQTNEANFIPPQIIVKWNGNTGKEIASRLEQTERDTAKPVEGAELLALVSNVRDCLINGDYLMSVHQSLARAMASTEQLKQVYLGYALNYRHIGDAVTEVMKRGFSLRKTSGQLRIKFHVAREAEMIFRLTESEDDLRQKVNEFNPDLSLTKSLFLDFLAGKVPSIPRVPTKRTQKVAPGEEETEEQKAARERERVEQLVLSTVNGVLDLMYEDDAYPCWLQASYAEASSFRKRIESRPMRERYRACLTVLSRAIEKGGK